MRLSQDVQYLLDNVIDSLVKWDLLMYIHKNPNDHVSAEKIAQSIARTADEVMIVLEELSSCKVLEYENDGEAIYYRFCPSKDLQVMITSFINCSMDRNTRWLILNYLIENNGLKNAG